MAVGKWVVYEESDGWYITLRGRFKSVRRSRRDAERYVKQHCQLGDKVFLKEDDGYLSDITKHTMN